MIQEIYTRENSEYLLKNPTWHVEDSPWKAKQVLKMLQRHNIAIKTVTEIGCGAGEILNQLHRVMPVEVSFTGYDISSDAITLAKLREKERLHFRHEDLLKAEASFDLLLMMDVFEHVENPLEFLRRCRTKANYHVFHIPLDISVQSVLRNKLMHWRSALGHLHYFTKETALATVQDAGYEVLDHFYTLGSIECGNNDFMSVPASLLRRSIFSLHQDVAVRLLGGFSLLVLAKS